MKYIPLTKGKRAIVDDDIYEALCQFKWCTCVSKLKKRIRFYAVHSVTISKNRTRLVSMHHAIVGKPLKGLVDHKNGDGLDNRRENLRMANYHENAFNSAKPDIDRPTSRFKGVHLHQSTGRWQAHIRIDGHKTYLGSFRNEYEAASAYNAAARRFHGEFANFNQIREAK